MNLKKRQARAKRRRRSMALVKRGVPHRCSKWSVHGGDYLGKGDGLTPGEVQSARKMARHADMNWDLV